MHLSQITYTISYLICEFSTLECFNLIMLYIRYADQISVGDEVFVPKNGVLTPAKVTYISTFKMHGVYHS